MSACDEIDPAEDRDIVCVRNKRAGFVRFDAMCEREYSARRDPREPMRAGDSFHGQERSMA